MKKQLIFILFLFGITASSFAQQIDTFEMVGGGIPPTLKVEGTFPHSGFKLLRAEVDTMSAGSHIFINLYYTEYCSGYQVITPFDTIVGWPSYYLGFPSAITLTLVKDTATLPCDTVLFPVPVDTMTIQVASVAGLTKTKQAKVAVSVLPNPASGKFTITGAKAGNTFVLLSATGKVVRQGTVSNSPEVNVKGLPTGVYILQLQTADGMQSVKVKIN